MRLKQRDTHKSRPHKKKPTTHKIDYKNPKNPKNFQKFPKNFQKSQKFPKNFPKISKNSENFQKFPKNFEIERQKCNVWKNGSDKITHIPKVGIPL